MLAQEVALNVAVLGRGQAVSQLHLGGGTPTFLSDDELSRLMAMLRDGLPAGARRRDLDRGRPAHRLAASACSTWPRWASTG